jgi:DNA-directed RNA polymerase specialized sigma24 family protein
MPFLAAPHVPVEHPYVEFVRAHQASLHNLARCLAPHAHVDDVVQEALLRLWLYWEEVQYPSTWTRLVLTRLCYPLYAAGARERELKITDVDLDLSSDDLFDLEPGAFAAPCADPTNAVLDDLDRIGDRLEQHLPAWVAVCRDRQLSPARMADDEVADHVRSVLATACDIADGGGPERKAVDEQGAPGRTGRGVVPERIVLDLLTESLAPHFPDCNRANGALAHRVERKHAATITYVLFRLVDRPEAAAEVVAVARRVHAHAVRRLLAACRSTGTGPARLAALKHHLSEVEVGLDLG